MPLLDILQNINNEDKSVPLAVEKALEKALSDTRAAPASRPPAVKTPAPPAVADDPDDIPF